MTDIYAKLAEIKRTGKNAVLCILTGTRGSTPRKAGSKMIVMADGKTYGTVGGGEVEQKVTAMALEMCGQSSPKFVKINLEEEADMQCGGSVDVYFEPVTNSDRVVIIGVGHVGGVVADFAKMLDFSVTLIDPRENLLDRFENKGFDLVREDFVPAAQNFESDENTYFVITTPKHDFDQELTAICAKKPHRYVGMMASKRKVALAVKHYLANKILTQAEINKIDMPIGLAINAETPEEIAVSIVAKLVQVRRSVAKEKK